MKTSQVEQPIRRPQFAHRVAGSGSVIAGVIGIRKFIYDVWGDTVNTASRLESHAAPGRTTSAKRVFEETCRRFAFRGARND